MNINTTINLDDLLNSNEETSSEETIEILKESITETAKSMEENAPLPDFDSIVTEWSYRCDKGYPDMKNKSDMIKLQEILNEMGIKSPFKQVQLTELDKPKKKSVVKTATKKKKAVVNTSGNTLVKDFAEKHKNLKILIKYLKDQNKLEQFEEYMIKLPQDKVAPYAAQELAAICSIDANAKKLADIFKSKTNIEAITSIKYKESPYKELHVIRQGLGPGEIMISWTIKGASTAGNSESYDIDFKGAHYEVKELTTLEGKFATIRPAKYGMTGRFPNFINPFNGFWIDIITPYFENKFREDVISITDNVSIQEKITKALDALELIPLTTPNKDPLPGVEMVHDIFDNFYENVKIIHEFLPKSVKASADINRLSVKSVSTDAKFWIDKDDVDDITKASGTGKEIGIKVGKKITDDTKDSRIWFSNLIYHPFVKKPSNFVLGLRSIRDGFAKNKAGLIYFYEGACLIDKDMSNFFTSNITSGQFRFDLKNRKKNTNYKYAKEQ